MYYSRAVADRRLEVVCLHRLYNSGEVIKNVLSVSHDIHPTLLRSGPGLDGDSALDASWVGRGRISRSFTLRMVS